MAHIPCPGFRWAGHVLYAMAMAHIVFFAISNNMHWSFKSSGFWRNFYKALYGFTGIVMVFFVVFYKDSRIEGILKDFYQDYSWIGVNGISMTIL